MLLTQFIVKKISSIHNWLIHSNNLLKNVYLDIKNLVHQRSGRLGKHTILTAANYLAVITNLQIINQIKA